MAVRARRLKGIHKMSLRIEELFTRGYVFHRDMIYSEQISSGRGLDRMHYGLLEEYLKK